MAKSQPILPMYGTSQPKKKAKKKDTSQLANGPGRGSDRPAYKPPKAAPVPSQPIVLVKKAKPKPTGVFAQKAPSTGVLAKPLAKVQKATDREDARRTELEGKKHLSAGELDELKRIYKSHGGMVVKFDKKAEQAAAPLPVKILANGVRDWVDINANTIPAVAHLGSEVVHGHFKQAANEVAQPYKDLAKDPIGQLEKHPLSTALLVAGPLKGADRAAGRVARQAGVKAASRVRPPAVVPHTGLEEPRPYPKGLVAKGAVKAKERVKPAPEVMSDSQIARRVDEHVAASEDIRRVHRAQAVDEAHKAISRVGKKKVKPTAATVVATQNIARPKELAAYVGGKARPDEIAAYTRQVETEGQSLTHQYKAANKTTVKHLKKAENADPADVAATARQYAKMSVRQQDELVKRGLISKEQADLARLTPYAVQHMHAHHDPKLGLIDEHGHPLPADGIRAHMAAHGVEEPAFVTHAPDQRGAKNYYVPTSKPPQVTSGTRSGEAVRKGTLDVHPQALVDQAAKSQGLIDAADRYAAFVKEFAVKGGSGKVKQLSSYKAAQNAAKKAVLDKDGNPIPGAVALRPIRLNPFLGKQGQLKATVDAVNEGLSATDGDAGGWALVPDAAAKRLQQHMATTGPGPAGRVANLYGGLWRKNVLAFSPKWLAGNTIEAATRSLIGRAGPRSYVTGRKVLRQLDATDPAMGLEARVRTSAGGHYSMVARNNVSTQGEHFAGTKLAPIATALGKIARTPGPREAVSLYRAYTDFVFHTLNGRIESQFQTAMLGKALRDSPLMDAHTLKMSSRAVDDAVAGLKNTNAQVELGRAVDRMYGKYGKFSPKERQWIAAYTPFLAWTMNALTFLGKVLPQDHPVLVAAQADAARATEEWRKQHGRYMDFLGQTPGQVPDFLQGSIPGKDGTYLPASKNTPFGLVSGGVESIPGLILPQWSDALAALKGQDWLGRSLNKDHTDVSQAKRLTTAAALLIESTIPGLSLGQAAKGGGIRQRVDPFMYRGKKTTAPAPAAVSQTGPKLPPLPKLPPAPKLPPLKLPPLPPAP